MLNLCCIFLSMCVVVGCPSTSFLPLIKSVLVEGSFSAWSLFDRLFAVFISQDPIQRIPCLLNGSILHSLLQPLCPARPLNLYGRQVTTSHWYPPLTILCLDPHYIQLPIWIPLTCFMVIWNSFITPELVIPWRPLQPYRNPWNPSKPWNLHSL